MDSLLYIIVVYPILFILPAYAANGAPVVFGGGIPIDMNKKFNKKPIFGKHKTVKGLVSGISSGIIVGAIESAMPGLGFMLYIGIAQSFGTHFGDLLGSFIKRQQGSKEGHKAELLDQYLFLIFAFIFSMPLGNTPAIYGIVFIFLLTWLMHRFTNKVAYRLRLKDVPW